MKPQNRSAIFKSGKHLGLLVLLLLIFVGIDAWRIGGSTLVAAQAVVSPAKTKVNPHDGVTYIWISPGTYQMGCSANDSECTDDEKPAHKVTLTRGFWIGQTLVTQAEYKKVVGSSPSHFQGDKLPVEHVSWDDAQSYCQSVEMRLPTEAEWEYAARGGSPAARYGPIDDIAWYQANSGNTSHEVAQKQPNGYGLYDMIGNIPEWVMDWAGPYSAADAVDPRGPLTGISYDSFFRACASCRVLRGGARDFGPSRTRVTYRHWLEPADRNHVNGFRCAANQIW